MGITERFGACTPRELCVIIEGDDREEFRHYVEQYLAQNPGAWLAHGATMEDILTKLGDNYIAVVKRTPITNYSPIAVAKRAPITNSSK